MEVARTRLARYFELPGPQESPGRRRRRRQEPPEPPAPLQPFVCLREDKTWVKNIITAVLVKRVKLPLHQGGTLLLPEPRKSVGLTWGNKSVHTELVPTFRNLDFSVGRMSTYELIK